MYYSPSESWSVHLCLLLPLTFRVGHCYINGEEMERLRFTIRNLFSHDQPSFKIYPKVPLEIVLEIFAHLESSDQICLSLCCKYLYEAFLYLLKLKRLDSARLYPPETRPLLCLNNEANERPRTRLLRQLEDKRWKFCNECWFLHPHDKRRANFFNVYAKVHDFISSGKRKGLGDRSMSQQSLARHRGVVGYYNLSR